MKSRHAMERLRSSVHVPQEARLRLIVSDARDLAIECCLCDELLEWNSDCLWWECGCGLEATVGEARALMELSRDVLETHIVDLGGRRYRRRSMLEWLRDWLDARLNRPKMPPPTGI